MANVIDIDQARAERVGPAAFERTPPHDLDAEAAVISAIMLASGTNDGGLALVADWLRPEHFYSEAHGRMYEAALALREAKEPVDVVTMGAWLKKHDRIAQVGGMSYMTELLNAAPAVANIVPYARTIHDRWRERQLIETTARISARGYLGIEDTQAYCDNAVRSLSEIARMSVVRRTESNVDALLRIVKAISERSSAATKVPLGLPTGIAAYDEEWGGLHGGEVTTIVARPKVGKTSLALQLLWAVASTGAGVLMFSQDSPRDDLLQDLLSHVAKVDSKRLRKGEISEGEWRRVMDASSEIGKRQFMVDDERGIHVGTVKSRAIATADEWLKKDRRPLGLVIVDYIQQLGAPPGKERAKKHEYIGSAARDLKTHARLMGVPFIVLAQQKRDENGKPVWQASDSSEIEKECDNLFFIEKLSDTARRLRCELVRRGARRSIDLHFDGPSRTFSDAKHEPESRKFVDRSTRAPKVTPAAASAPVDDDERPLPEPPPGLWDDEDDGSLGALVGKGQ